MRLIGQVLGARMLKTGHHKIVIGRDARLTSPALVEALQTGLQHAGVTEITNAGLTTSPMVYYAASGRFDPDIRCGVVVTASHNPGQFNGLKFIIDGLPLTAEELQDFGQDVIALGEKDGDCQVGTPISEDASVETSWMAALKQALRPASGLKIVVDAGNAVAGAFAPSLYRSLGVDVDELYCDLDGRFPNHHPDPAKPENLVDLQARVLETGADLGIAFDGDGDRVGVVTSSGRYIPADQLFMWLASIALRDTKGRVLYDVKSTAHMRGTLEAAGGTAELVRTGHSFIKLAIARGNAVAAGEVSGHLSFPDRWINADDAIYAGGRVLEALAEDGRSLDDIMSEFPTGVTSGEVIIDIDDSMKQEIVEKTGRELLDALPESAVVTQLDGTRIDYADGFGLIRMSNSSPAISLCFEGKDEAALARIRQTFAEAIKLCAPAIDVSIVTGTS